MSHAMRRVIGPGWPTLAALYTRPSVCLGGATIGRSAAWALACALLVFLNTVTAKGGAGRGLQVRHAAAAIPK